jgi:photosystem II stability/assembly factor-like uncharacterized protein
MTNGRRLVFSGIALGLIVAAVLLADRTVFAQQVNPNLYSGMKWRMIGPFRGGRVLAVAGIPGNPSVYYFAANGGGVWKSTDGGTVWKPIFDREPVASIGALALAPSNPNIIFVGTGENSLHSQVSYGNGVYKSTDGGETWQHLGLDDSHHIGKILVDPRNPDIVLVAAMGHVYGPNVERGVFRSTDGGRTWKKVLYKDDVTGAVDLCFAPDNSRVVYATLWHPIRKPWDHGTSYGPGGGIYKSTDGGATWTELAGHGLPAGDLGRIGIAVAPGNHGRRVYAIIEAKKDSGLYRSDDAGATWQRTTTDPRIAGIWFFGQVFADPHNADVVYVPETSVYRSTDAGRTFTSIKGAPGGDDYHVVWIDPENTQRMILGCDQGATISLDGGQTWSSWYNQPTAQFYHVATDHRYPYYVYGAQQDSGTAATASRGDYGQITERDWNQVGPGESGYTLPDPLDPNIVYNAGPGGSVVRIFRNTGQMQDISPAPIALGSKLRLNWTIPLAFSPQDSHTLYLGAQYVMKTTNSGASWQAISPDLTVSSSDNSEGKDRGTVYTIAPSPVREGVIWAGTDSGLIHVTRNGGATWQNVTPPGLSPWSEISLIEASHWDAAIAYAAVNRQQLDDFKPRMFRTRDFGETWQEIVGGIRDGDFVRAVREDPVRKGLLYAGTEMGVYVSFNDGDHWQSLQLNMPTVSVRDLAIEQDDLVAATHGRSFWILDDITPLRQAAPEVATSNAYLFEPRPAIRIRRDENQNTPLPPEIPAGKNPPNGAILDYYLQSTAADEVAIEIHDSEGKLICRFSSNALPPSQEPVPYVATFWIAHPEPLSKEAGMHRFVWDLRYPDPPAVRLNSPYSYPISAIVGDTPAQPQGPLVLPGNYEVRFTIAGRTYTRPLVVKMDPRVAYARSDLESQLSLELKISGALERDTTAYQQVKDLRSRLSELMKRPAGDPVAVAATALDKKVADLESETAALWEEPKKVTFARLNESLITLIGLVDSADFAPTQQQAAAFQQSCQALNSIITDWRELKARDLPALNSLLKERSVAPLPAEADVSPDASCAKP